MILHNHTKPVAVVCPCFMLEYMCYVGMVLDLYLYVDADVDVYVICI